jgi:hypothetical protein
MGQLIDNDVGQFYRKWRLSNVQNGRTLLATALFYNGFRTHSRFLVVRVAFNALLIVHGSSSFSP